MNRLLALKDLVNAKRFTSSGVQKDIVFNEDDNLIIKGNNLLGLSSLLNKYAGKVKFISIDPPYYFKKTKSTDAFLYNANYKLSTWLTL